MNSISHSSSCHPPRFQGGTDASKQSGDKRNTFPASPQNAALAISSQPEDTFNRTHGADSSQPAHFQGQPEKTDVVEKAKQQELYKPFQAISDSRGKAAEFSKPQIEVIASLGIVKDVLPLQVAGAAAITASRYPYSFKALNYVCSLTADLTMKRMDLPAFKTELDKVAYGFNCSVDDMAERLRKDQAAKPHVQFLSEVAQSLTAFSKRIEGKDESESLTEAIAFQTKLAKRVATHIQNYGNTADQENLSNLQAFLNKYHQNLTTLPGSLESLSLENRAKLAPLAIQAPGTKTRELLEWTKSHTE